MLLTLSLSGESYVVDLDRPFDISIPLAFDGAQPHAFGLPRAVAHAVDAGSFVGDTRRGGSCNCETITLNPHGSGTHTECAGHVTRERVAVAMAARDPLVPCTLISVTAASAATSPDADAEVAADRVVTRQAIERALIALGERPTELLRALVIRTLPNDDSKRSAEYTGSNPIYLTLAAMHLVRELGVEHLVVDLPSVDREDDGGSLSAHRIFFGVDESRALVDDAGARRTITEMAFVPDELADGPYLLSLQLPPFMLDAAPSRPVLLRLERAA
jgi:arylformamidase